MSDWVVAARDVDVPAREGRDRAPDDQYTHAIDNDELERSPQFFTAKGAYQIIPRTALRTGPLIERLVSTTTATC